MEEILIRFVINLIASILMHCVIKRILKNKNIANTMLNDDVLREYYLTYEYLNDIPNVLLPTIYNILIMSVVYVIRICFAFNYIYLMKIVRTWFTLQLFIILVSIIPCLAGYLTYKYEVESQR